VDGVYVYAQDDHVEAPVAERRTAASTELLQFTDKYLDAEEGSIHLDEQGKDIARVQNTFGKSDDFLLLNHELPGKSNRYLYGTA